MSVSFKDSVDIADKLVGIAAILLAGAFAYFKFFKERLYRPRLEITVSARFLPHSANVFLEVTASVKNTGLTKVEIDLKPSGLMLFGAASLASGRVDEPTWKDIGILDVAERHDWIEPNELLRQTWLVTIPEELRFPAYRVEFRLAGKTSEWYADTVLVPQAQGATQSQPSKEAASASA